MSDELKPQRFRASAFALVFASALPQLQEIARGHGYALAVHGSMATDLDLIAVPWVREGVSDEATLIEALRVAIGGTIREQDAHPDLKPHGRNAYSIYCNQGWGPYLDVSVMPRKEDWDER
jgi:hypothetical protein